MKPTRWYTLVLAFLAALFAGCSVTDLRSNVPQHANLEQYQSYYVARLASDERGVEEIIADALRQRGLEATSGEADGEPENVDVLVSYEDRWMWDITMYMLQINIEFRDPSTDVLIADGMSYRTSLVREPPEVMVNEVLQDMFSQ
jgi:hypothetical protein